MTFEEFVRQEAAAVHSDGCTFVGPIDHQLYEICCFEHDLGYHWGKDVRDAFRLKEAGEQDYWTAAKGISRSQVDGRFRDCNMQKDPLGRYSPIAWGRWLGVRVGGFLFWKH